MKRVLLTTLLLLLTVSILILEFLGFEYYPKAMAIGFGILMLSIGWYLIYCWLED